MSRGGAAARSVATLVWPADRLLRGFRIVVVPLLCVLAAVVEVAARPNVHGVAIAAGLVVLGLFAWIPRIAAPVNGMIARLYRRQSLAADFRSDDAAGQHRVAWLLTPDLFRAPHFRYDDQTVAVNQFVELCRAGSDTPYWIVEGDSGSGKTRTALLLAQTLTRDRELCGLGQRCYLYDFSSQHSQRAAVQHLGTESHQGQIVLVDNFHMVSPRTLEALTRRFLDRPGTVPERVVVFMASPLPFWSLNPGSDVSLIETAKNAGRHRVLRGPTQAPLLDQIRNVSERVASGIELLAPFSPRATGVQMHLAQTAMRRGAHLAVVGDVLDIVSGTRRRTPDPSLVASLAIVSALAMHRGAFGLAEYRTASRYVTHAHADPSPTVDDLKDGLKRLRRSGVVPSGRALGRRLTFHEGFAELCIDRLSSSAGFSTAFRTAAEYRLNDGVDDGPVEQWLIAVELNKAHQALALFDRAASAGAYARMEHCLERLARRVPLEELMRVQRAILLDRVGRFEEARSVFATIDARQLLSSDPMFGAMLLSGRIEAAHDAQAVRDSLLLANHADPVIAAVGEYWTLHVAGHRGSFAAHRLSELATSVAEATSVAATHWTSYATLRMYADSLRHLYLSGDATLGSILSPSRQSVGRSLRRQLAITEAFDTLYTKAHFLGHVLLPGLAIYSVAPTSAEAEQVDLAADGGRDIEHVLDATAHEYRRARGQFAIYGDREALYLQIDETNIQMIRKGADLAEARVALGTYQTFIQNAGFSDIASYPHLYLFRWHTLSYLDSFVRGGPASAADTDMHLAAARDELRLVTDLDTAAGNEYGVFRASVLRALLRQLRKPPGREWADTTAREALARGYGIEAKLANFIGQRRSVSQLDILTILRFYPFVHQ